MAKGHRRVPDGFIWSSILRVRPHRPEIQSSGLRVLVALGWLGLAAELLDADGSATVMEAGRQRRLLCPVRGALHWLKWQAEQRSIRRGKKPNYPCHNKGSMFFFFLFWPSDLLGGNPGCRFYECVWYMTAIHRRFTPEPILLWTKELIHVTPVRPLSANQRVERESYDGADLRVKSTHTCLRSRAHQSNTFRVTNKLHQ